MNTKHFHRSLAVVLIAAALAAVPLAAQATGTAVTTPISNRANVQYDVGAVTYTVESAPTGNAVVGAGAGTDTTFVVDDKVILTVTNDDIAPVNTIPGATGQTAMTFTVTNGGNGPHDVVVSAANIADSITGGPSAVVLYEDTNANGAYNPGIDQQAGAGGVVYLLDSAGTVYIDEMPAAPAAGSSRIVFAVINTPITALNAEAANYSLTARAYNDLAQVRTGGTAGSLGNVTAANTGDADDPTLIDIVLAETGGTDGTDYNGIYTADGAFGFTVVALALTVQKTSAVISDGISAVNPKAIPLAIMEYTIRVTYTGGSGTAANISLNDTVPLNTVAQTDVYGVSGEVQRTVDDGTGPVTVDLDQAALTSWGTPAGSAVSAPCGISFDAVNDYCEIRYRVQIQ